MNTLLPRRKTKSKARGESLLGLLLVAPLVLWIAGTFLYPLISSIHLSFYDIGIIGTQGKFIGFQNYHKILTGSFFWSAFMRSVIWVVGNAVLQTIAAFISALILMQAFRWQSAARIWIILSWIVPTVVLINLLLHYLHFRNFPLALVVFSGIPVAAAGGKIGRAHV